MRCPSGEPSLDATTRRTVDLSPLNDHFRLFGKFDQNLSALEDALSVALRVEGNALVLHGESTAVEQAYAVVQRMLNAAVGGAQVTPDDVALDVRRAAGPFGNSASRDALSLASRQRAAAEDCRAARVRRIDRTQHADVRHRAGGHRKNVS